MVLPHPTEVLEIVQRDIQAHDGAAHRDERERLTGVGLAQPFNLGSWLRELGLPADTFRAWDEMDFASELGARSVLPVFSENDGNAAAIAELFYGCGRQCDDFIYLSSSAGDRRRHRGRRRLPARRAAAMRAISASCRCRRAACLRPAQPAGQWDILLSRASLNALARHLRYSGESIENRADLEACIARSLPAVDEWIDDCVDALAPALRSMLCVLDVPVVVLDADIDAGLLDTLIERLRATMGANAPESRDVPVLARGSFGRMRARSAPRRCRCSSTFLRARGFSRAPVPIRRR